MSRRPRANARVFVDPVSCEAVGLCAYLAPDVITLDRWGYPLLPPGEVRAADLRAARRAVRACPRRALHLEAVDADDRR